MLLSHSKNPLSGDAKVKKPNIPDGSRNGEDVIRRLAEEFPRIVSIKDSSGDISHMMRLIAAVRPIRPDFSFLTGRDSALVPMLLAGCDGGPHATSGVVPEPVSMKALPGNRDLVRQLCLSSELRCAAPAKLAVADIPSQPIGGRLIDDFSNGWRDWYRHNVGNPVHWQNWTRKVTDAAWRGPDGAALAITLTMPKTNRITVVVVENEWRSERGQKRTFNCTREIQGNAEPQTITFSAADFASTEEKLGALESWASVDVLGLCGFHSDERPQRTPVWDGPLPDFRRVEWRY